MLEFNNKGAICQVVGQLSQQEVIQLWPQVDALVDKQIESLDLSKLLYSDTAGVALLLYLLGQATSKGQSLKLLSTPPQLQKLIDLYNLQDFFAEEIN